MDHDTAAYGLWTLVVIDSLVFIIFAFSFSNRTRSETGARLVLSPLSSSRCLQRCTAFR